MELKRKKEDLDVIEPLNKKVYKKINIFTDGSCKPNPGKGGYGVIIVVILFIIF